MAGGWARDGAIQDQIDATVDDAVKKARERLGKGESLSHCAECGDVIPEARRAAIQGVHYCIGCQSELDDANKQNDGINRRGSKDSQLR